jgi:NADPH:quinone reductase-like Zn-dependent oxidoreductase
VCAEGARVWFATSAGMAPGDGGLAERCAVPDGDVVPLTVPVRDDDVAALGLSAVAAWMALTWRARMQPGEKVVVLGGGGAVGQVALGAARLLGAERIVAVCRSDAAAERARRAGADAVVRLTEDVDAVAAALTAALDGTAEVVIDPVFGIAATAASRVLGPGGRLVNLGGASGDLAELSSSVLRSRFVDVLGYTNNALTAEQRAQALTAVVEQAARGALSVDHAVLPLADVAEGWRRTGDGGRRVVVVP